MDTSSKLFERLGLNSGSISLFISYLFDNILLKKLSNTTKIIVYTNIIDEIPIFCAAAVVANGVTKIINAKELKYKESNRITSTKRELKRLYTDKKIDTYDDHRIAMSFAPLCLAYGEIKIQNTGVVSKSYPNFWDDLKKGGFIISPSTG